MSVSIQGDIQAAERALPAPQSSRVSRFSDLDLQLCRRVDWRFLLPNSHLGRVAYFGKERTRLAAALERFSDRLTMFSSRTSVSMVEGLAGSFDVAVVSSPTTSGVECAAKLLKDGGWLYVEAGWKAKGVNAYRTDLLNAGFREVQAFWHRPSFDACREIVPLDDVTALNYVLSRARGDLAGNLKSMIARCARRAGLLPFVLPCFSLIGRKHSEAARIS